MKRIPLILIASGIVLMVFIIFFENTFPRGFHQLITSSTDLSHENIEGIYVGDNIKSNKVTKKYEIPTEKSRDVEKYNYYLLRDGVEIATDQAGRISRFIITDQGLPTAKGIHIGDTKEDVIRKYEKHHYTRSEQGFDIVGYVDKKRKISLEFWLADGKLEFYRFDEKSMK
ncbi:hypothetical protein [Bacillus sp. FJAT-29814]|uniref:hypothetical protein n=1 Tax=Bacillus sp. FJAT-29814 TaxID=1729688 RepID=UPI00083686D7|nr:hypothetical protein [Bacillus sp. FJAT-29814]